MSSSISRQTGPIERHAAAKEKPSLARAAAYERLDLTATARCEALLVAESIVDGVQ